MSRGLGHRGPRPTRTVWRDGDRPSGQGPPWPPTAGVPRHRGSRHGPKNGSRAAGTERGQPRVLARGCQGCLQGEPPGELSGSPAGGDTDRRAVVAVAVVAVAVVAVTVVAVAVVAVAVVAQPVRCRRAAVGGLKMAR